MPPYNPPYLHDARAKRDRTDEALIAYIDYVEDVLGEFTPQANINITRLESQAKKAETEYALAWERWQADQKKLHALNEYYPCLTVQEFYAFGLNEKAESELLPTFPELRNEQFEYSTTERSIQ